jgi:hypothetical protein
MWRSFMVWLEKSIYWLKSLDFITIEYVWESKLPNKFRWKFPMQNFYKIFDMLYEIYKKVRL